MNDPCGCCEGTQQLTPKLIANRPGLAALVYRIGTHAAFLETMKARLSSGDYPELAGLTTRESDDPSIALLDAWATLADVLTFYQERIANEGYLRTATERRSILELARLVGYALRPGVASTAYLAYTLDNNAKEPVIIPAGARVQSAPGPGELPQSFETAEKFEARAAWNILKPRMTKPQYFLNVPQVIYLKGVSTNLKPNDPLVVVDAAGMDSFQRVQAIEIDREAQRTKVTLQIKGDIDLEIAALEPLIRSQKLPEEEGPYSVVIGDWALRIIVERLRAFLLHLRDPQQTARKSREDAYLEIAYLEQTARIYRALNLDILAGWVDSVLERLKAIDSKLRLRTDATGPADRWNLDAPSMRLIRLLLDRVPAIPGSKSFSREILQAELGGLKNQINTLLGKSTALEWPGLQLQIRAIALCVQQLQHVFSKLGFGDHERWAETLLKALHEATGSGEAVPHRAELARTAPLFPQLTQLVKPPSLLPRSAVALERRIETVFSINSLATPRLLVSVQPMLKDVLFAAWQRISVGLGASRVYALRTRAAVFGYNVPHAPVFDSTGAIIKMPEWPVQTDDEKPDMVFLDSVYEGIAPGGYVAVQRPELETDALVFRVTSVVTRPRSAYGLSAKSTQLGLSEAWWQPRATGEASTTLDTFAVIRGTNVFAQSELLELAEEPLDTDVDDDTIELDRLYDGLEAGRWLIISGERTDIRDTDGTIVRGVQGQELVMLADVTQSVRQIQDTKLDLPGDTPHTKLVLSNVLASHYKRDTVVIYGNVVTATHGETRNEVLGSGDGSQVFQSFVLKQPPLTYVAAPTPAGAESTLHVRVNDVEWHETDSLASLGPTDRRYITRTDDESKTTIIFGNGQVGARPPSGVENIKAIYRNGIGKAGNVKAEQIRLLATRPLGVKEVINPLRASGGADKESRDQARKNAPLAVMALDRLVSTQDYADFARTFAGIGKASAARLTDGRRQYVYITIAGADDIPIDKSSDLYHNLVKALRENGDPYQPIMVEARELVLILLSANVRILPDYQWESVVVNIRTKLLHTFSFERRELGQDVLLSEIISTIHAVEGVAYVDVDTLGGVSEKDETGALRTPEDIAGEVQQLIKNQEKEPTPRIRVQMARVMKDGPPRPAQLAFLTPDVEATLALNEVKS